MSASFAESIVQLAEMDIFLGARELAQKYPTLCSRDAILMIADEVNRAARQDLSRAERLADLAILLADATNDDFCRGRARRCLGNVKVLQGRHSDALNHLCSSFKLFQNVGAELEQAATLSSSIQPLIYEGKYAQALEKADQAKDIAVRHGDELLLARLEVNSGNILHRQDRFAEAVEGYRRGLEKLQKLGYPRDCAVALVNLAVCYISLHDFRKAEKAYATAREISERENMQTIVAQADYNIAYLYFYRSQYRQAIELYRQTRLYCDKFNDQYHSALCDLDQAELYLELRLHQEGIGLAKQALVTFDKIGLSYEANKAIVLLGIGAYQNKKPFYALEQFARAQECMRMEANSSWVATLDLYQALVLQQEGRYYEALRHCRQAEQSLPRIASHLLAETQLLMTALYSRLEQTENAEKWRKEAVRSAQTLRSAAHLSRAYLLSAQLHETLGSDIEASRDYDQALYYNDETIAQPYSELSKIPQSENRLELYEGIIALGLKMKAPLEELFQYIEKVKARELSDLVRFRMNALPPRSRNKSVLVEQVNSLREELSWYYRKSNSVELSTSPRHQDQAQELRSVIKDQEHSLATTLGELQALDKELHSLLAGSTIPAHEIRQQVSADELLVEFFIARGLIFVCLVKQAGFEILPVAHLDSVRREMRHLRLSLYNAVMDNGEPVFDDVQLERTMASLRILHKKLIAPLGDRLSGKRLVIVPVGPLHYLPFHALSDGEQFMCEKYLMSYAASASLHYLSSTKRSYSSAADDVAIIPEIPLECKAVRDRFVQARRLKDIEREGLTHRFVHLECGIRLRRDNVLFSTLSIGKDEICLLDTFHLQLPCDVLSLAGCGTGIHAKGDGRELLSLSQGLEYAGARTILLPLWNGPHKSMGMFFDVFYQGAACDSDMASVFRKSILEVRHRYPHPFCWAPMTLRGKSWRDRQSGREVDSNGVEKADSYSNPAGFASNANHSLQGRR